MGIKQIMMNKSLGKNLNNSVAKAFALLEYFTVKKPEWGVRELAVEVGASASTTYRLMATLENLGALKKNPLSEKYSLGLKLFELGNRVEIQRVFVKHTHPELEKVAEEIKETVHLGILRNHQVFMVDRIESPKGLKLDSIIGTYSPAYCSGLGKILLAHLPLAQSKQTLEAISLIPNTKFTITKITRLLKELQTVQQQGFAIDREELEEGLICVAVPIYNQNDRVVAALSAAGPANRFREDAIGDYVAILQKGAQAIQQKIGNFQPENS